MRIALLLCCVAGVAFGQSMTGLKDKATENAVAKSIATNAVASVTDAALLAEWIAANNQTKKDAVILKLLQRNAEIEAAKGKVKKAQRDKIKEPKK